MKALKQQHQLAKDQAEYTRLNKSAYTGAPAGLKVALKALKQQHQQHQLAKAALKQQQQQQQEEQERINMIEQIMSLMKVHNKAETRSELSQELFMPLLRKLYNLKQEQKTFIY